MGIYKIIGRFTGKSVKNVPATAIWAVQPESFQPKSSEADDRFLTKEQLRERLNLPSTRMVDQLMRRRKIPYIKLGHRTIRFDLAKVMAALEKFEHKAVGQK